MKSAVYLFLSLFFILSCTDDDVREAQEVNSFENGFTYLALGDSYTVGQSVCSNCGFPEQLADTLAIALEKGVTVKPVAVTGWTSGDLLEGIANASLDEDYDLVTLLIGVNNQFQSQSFSVFENDFPELLEKALEKAGNNPRKLIVLSLPDYSFTPFGSGLGPDISTAINAYNSFIQSETSQAGVRFIDITDITRRGLEDPRLVASDGLHCSEKAYRLFVERLYAPALAGIRN